jgi:prepilin-type N-terminal cleavage/methylation domain-containing protein
MVGKHRRATFCITIHSETKALEKKSGNNRRFSGRGFSLIELMVSMFILVVVMGAMVVVSISGLRSYQKSRAIKTVTEDLGYAVNSIAKEVRMGRIDSDDSISSIADRLVITRNRDLTPVCYVLSETALSLCNNDCLNGCTSVVDLSGTGMTFAASSGFRNQKTDIAGDVRGWAEINLNVDSPGMETDSIFVQTTVSSRDYGWEEMP